MSNQVQKIENTREILSREDIHCPSWSDVFERFIAKSGISRVEAERMVKNIDGIREVIVRHQEDQMRQLEADFWTELLLCDVSVKIFVKDWDAPDDDHIPPGFKRYDGIYEDSAGWCDAIWTENKDKKRRGLLQRVIAALFG